VGLRHLVLFRVHDEVTEDAVDRAAEALTRLADLPGIVSWRVARSTDCRKERVLVEDATLWRSRHVRANPGRPEHVRVAGALSAISDLWIGDYDAE
jgi:hypothetical protein